GNVSNHTLWVLLIGMRRMLREEPARDGWTKADPRRFASTGTSCCDGVLWWRFKEDIHSGGLAAGGMAARPDGMGASGSRERTPRLREDLYRARSGERPREQCSWWPRRTRTLRESTAAYVSTNGRGSHRGERSRRRRPELPRQG